MTADEVLVEEQPGAQGKRLGVITLNAERTLNALKLPMLKATAEALERWASRDDIACVVLQSAGPKAFCAGGDLQSLYRSIIETRGQGPNGKNRFAEDFFAAEYRLDYAIRTYEKPILCWGHGFVMGGGLGIMAGASHRVVTESSRLAMPEITIGLYPDAGGTWFLNRMPDRVGLFLALTGATLNAHDALQVKLADHFLAYASRPAVLTCLREMTWSNEAALNRGFLTRELKALENRSPLPESQLLRHREQILRLIAAGSLPEIHESFASLTADDPWLAKSVSAFLSGSPTSAALAFRFHGWKNPWTLSQALQIEYTTSLQCCTQGDLAEGIRALIIDKDKKPRWSPASIKEVTPAWIEAHYPLPADLRAHPLADLTVRSAERPAASGFVS